MNKKNIPAPDNKNSSKVEKKNSKLYRIFNFFVKSSVIFAFLLSFFLLMLAYSRPFRQFFLDKATTIANTFLIADLELGDIHVLGLHGISLQQVRLITSNDTLAYIPELELNINFENIFSGVIDINYIKLTSPRIKLLRSSTDSIWNYQKIVAESDAPEPASSEPSKIKIKIKELLLDNASFIMWDSTANWAPHGHINFNKLVIDEFDLSLQNVDIKLETMTFETDIVNLSAVEKQSGFKINKLAMTTRIDASGIKVKNAEIVLPEANLNFSADILNFNIFDDPDISEAKMRLELSASEINPEFIDNFAIIPVKIGNVKDLYVNAEGTLENLNVNKIILDVANSHIEYTNGKLTNLLDSEYLTYSGTFNNTKINRKDFANILENIDLSSVPNFGQAVLNNIYFSGSTRDIFATINIRSSIGSISGRARIGFGIQSFPYEIDLQVRNFNLENILDDKSFSSDLNSNIKLNGRGFEIGSIFSDLEVEFLNSKINKYYLNNSNISLKSSGDSIIINKFKIVQTEAPLWHNKIHDAIFTGDKSMFFEPTNSYSNLEKSSISASGSIKLNNISSPHFILDINLDNINLQELTDNTSLPIAISGDINLDLFDIDIDSLYGDFKLDLTQIDFSQKSMLPVNISGAISEYKSANRQIEINITSLFSNILYCLIEGEYSIKNITSTLDKQIEDVSYFFENKIESFTKQLSAIKEHDTTHLSKNIKNTNSKYANIPTNISLLLKSNDLDFINMFLPDFKSNSAKINTKINYYSSASESLLTIDSTIINNLNINYKEDTINISKLLLFGSAKLSSANSLVEPTDIKINITQGNNINLNQIKLDSISLTTTYSEESYGLNFSGVYNNILKAELSSTALINNTDIFDLAINKLNLYYKNNIWHNDTDIKARISNNGLSISNCKIIRDNKESLILSGNIYNDSNNISLSLYNFELTEISSLLPQESEDSTKKIQTNNTEDLFAHLDSLRLVIVGTFQAPVINLDCSIDKIRYENQIIGKLNTELNYTNNNITGNAKMFDSKNKNLLDINIKSIPIYLTLDNSKSDFIEYDDFNPIDIKFNLSKLPAKILSPFIPEVDNLDGFINASVNIGGILPDNISYFGDLHLDDLTLRILPTNLRYMASGNITVETNRLYFNKLKVRNAVSDLRDGEASLDGEIKLEKFELKYMDFSLRSKQFLILSDASIVPMPWFYGKMIIATENENEPIRFYGTMTEPNLSGSLTILAADMKMPNILDNGIIKKKTNFNYINKDTMRLTVTSYRDSANINSSAELNNNSKKNGASNDFVDLLNIDLFVKLKRFSILLDLGIGQIFARIGTSNPAIPIHYNKLRTNPEAKITGGEIEVLEGSSVQIMRTMAATGTISFPTARISQPNLNLVAEYKGKMLDGNNNYNNFSVFLKITGAATRPNLSFSYSINGVEATGDTKQTEENAIILLTTGRLKGYNNDVNSNLINEGASIIASQFASRTLTDLLMKTGVVQTANLQFEGENFNSAEVKISGTIGGVATWTIGGKLDDIASSYNISIDIPVTVKAEGLNNLVLQLSKSTDLGSTSFDKAAKFWEAKLKLGGSW